MPAVCGIECPAEGPQVCCCKSLLTGEATALSTTTACAIGPGIPRTTST